MYKVQIFCTIPEFVTLTANMRNQLRREKLEPNGVTVHTFNSKEDFYAYVRRMDYASYLGGQAANHFLDAVMCNPNDTRRHRKGFTMYRNPKEAGRANQPYFYVGYLTKDAKNRVIDLRNYVTELYAFDLNGYEDEIHSRRWEEYAIQCVIRDAEQEKDLREGKDYWAYYRRMQTTQERRYSQDPDHKPFVRSRRSFASLPNEWDDYYFRREKSWKARNKKAKRNWEVNLSQHVDTIPIPPKWDGFEEFEEYYE